MLYLGEIKVSLPNAELTHIGEIILALQDVEEPSFQLGEGLIMLHEDSLLYAGKLFNDQ